MYKFFCFINLMWEAKERQSILVDFLRKGYLSSLPDSYLHVYVCVKFIHEYGLTTLTLCRAVC